MDKAEMERILRLIADYAAKVAYGDFAANADAMEAASADDVARATANAYSAAFPWSSEVE